jgi:hypothetical protein
MGGILIIMRASSQEAEARPRDAERALFRQDAKLFLHPIARFAAHSIRKIPPMEFQNLQHSYIAYKVSLADSMAVKVDAYHTSQACPTCGYVSPSNRPNKGLLFMCQSCHYSLHADLVGARNVALRTLLVRQDWMSTGVLSIRPDVSCGGAQTQAPDFRRGVIDQQITCYSSFIRT